MNKKILSLFLALTGAAALAGPREFKSDYFPLEKNIAVDIFAPGAVRADIAISIPSLKEAQHFEIVGNDGRLKGGVYLNCGSAVVLPEVFLKAVAISRNSGADLSGLTTVNLDFIRHYRPQTNVVTRPVAGIGVGISLVGHHEILIPLLAAAVSAQIAQA